MPEYFLPRHVHYCQRGDALIFLDLRHDDYTLVNGECASAFKALLAQAIDPNRETTANVRELLEGGLLTTDRGRGKIITPTQVALAVEPLVAMEASAAARITAPRFVRFVAACAGAAARLRWLKIEQTVSTVEERKARAGASATMDLDLARELTATFVTLRALFPKNYVCLYDSLALIEFLAGYRIFPDWVFGVRLEPWAAHCWIQHGHYVFNEGVEEAAGFTPVMVV